MDDAALEVAALVDGRDYGHDSEGNPVRRPMGESLWRLPLPPLSATSWPEAYSPGSDDAQDRGEAARRLLANHGAVARFATRGAGQRGARPVSAPLSDPTAVAVPELSPAVDACLRACAAKMTPRATPVDDRGSDDDVRFDAFLRAEALDVAAAALPASSRVDAARSVSASLRYLRDRVGVPRDMSLPAARQFRAHLNWVADAVLRLALAEEGGQV